MSANQLPVSHNSELETITGNFPVLCTAEVGGTHVIQSIDEQQRPNLELRNLQEESEWLYQDHQKTHQKLKSLEEENEELKNKNALLHGKLTTVEQSRAMERIEYQRQLQNKDEEITRLKQTVNAQSEECAALKQVQAENSKIQLKYENALQEYTKLKTENTMMDTMVENYEKCRENNKQLQNEINEYKKNEYKIRCDENEMSRKLILMNEENRKLREEINQVKVFYDLIDHQYRHESEKRKKLEKKLQILQGEIHTDMNQPKQRFTLRRSYLPECERCKSCLFQNGVVNGECKYHPIKPLPYRSWIRMLPEDLTDGKSSKNLYWQCCKKFSTIEPEGCASRPCHVIRSVPD